MTLPWLCGTTAFMKMFSDCSGSCVTCTASGGGCLAGHGDDDYSPISKEEALARIEKGRWGSNRLTDKPGRVYTPSDLAALRKHAGLDSAPSPGHSVGEWPECCEEGQKHIRWATADNFSGPDEMGWVINLHGGGDLYRERILFCPWCGKRLDWH